MAAGGQTRAPELDEDLLAMFRGRHLSPAQRRIAQYLLDHLREVVFLSSVELAERAGVSQPSVTRFATALGFSGYPDLRRALRPLVTGDEPVRHGPERNDFQAAVDADLHGLEALREQAGDPAVLHRVGRALAGSVPLPVLGLRVSAAVAQSFGYRAQRVHPDVRILTDGDVVPDELLRARQSGASWLLAFVLPRYPVAAADALTCARRLGLRCAVVTDRALAPFARPADELLTCGINDRFVFDSHAAPLVLSMLLLKALVDAEPERAQRRLEEYERLTRASGVFLPE